MIEDLIIHPDLNNIYNLINNDEKTAIIASTGTGKSLGIPWILAKSNLRVFVSVPTIVAAKSLAKYQPFKSVGYGAEGLVKYDKKTKVVYCTSGHLRRKIESYHYVLGWKNIDFCDVIIIDEIHTGILDNDIIMLLLDNAKKETANTPKIVLCSATFPVNVYEEYIKYEIMTKSYDIKTIYCEHSYKRDTLIDDTIRLIKKIHLEDQKFKEGDILVFVSGVKEIEDIIRDIECLPNIKVLPAYSMLTYDELSEIYVETKDRKIIIATNIAEASITIPDVGIIIDTLTEKRSYTSISGGLCLKTVDISIDSADQRRGRTGRNREGKCFRMCSEQFFDQLEQSRPKEIERVPIHNVMIELINSNFEAIELLSPVIEIERLIDSMNVLEKLNMVKIGKITKKGQFAGMLPLSIRNSAILYEAKMKNLPMESVIAIVSLIECYGPSYFYYPRRRMGQDLLEYTELKDHHKEKYFEKFIGDDDVDTLANLWSDFVLYCRGTTIYNIKSYCKINSLNNKKFREAYICYKRCCNILRTNEEEYFDFTIIKDDFLSVIREAYSDRIMEKIAKNKYKDSNDLTYNLETKNEISNIFTYDGPIVSLIDIEINRFRIISLACKKI